MQWNQQQTSQGSQIPPVCLSLLVINIAVHLFNPLRDHSYFFHGHASYGTIIELGQYWRLVTYQFLHADFIHLAFNMYALWAFGRYVETYWRSWWKFLLFYLVSGCAGAIAYMTLLHLGILSGNPWTPLVGASGSIYAILAAVTVLAPNIYVQPMFVSQPMPLKTFALILIGVGAIVILSDGFNAGGEAAHLGGALVGYLLMKNSLTLRR